MKEGRISWAWRGRVRRERVRDSGVVRSIRDVGAGMGSRMIGVVRWWWSWFGSSLFEREGKASNGH